ncbi:hypothetical protein D1872_291270 [compost metagenome]
MDNSSLFINLGIGVLSINGKAVEIIEARKSHFKVNGIQWGIIENLNPELEFVLDEQGKIYKAN